LKLNPDGPAASIACAQHRPGAVGVDVDRLGTVARPQRQGGG
jgi:hypothetical protein